MTLHHLMTLRDPMSLCDLMALHDPTMSLYPLARMGTR
jgi:hypothetical protein